MRHAIPVAMLIAACSVAQAQEPKSRPVFKSIPDQALGLSCSSVFEVPSPPLFTDDASAPGDKTLPPRLNRETPPVIPHGITDFLPLTRAANMCLDCHEVPGAKKKGEPTPLPASHYVDYRNAPWKRGGKVAGARWVCTACHVPQTDAKPLVGTTYRR